MFRNLSIYSILGGLALGAVMTDTASAARILVDFGPTESPYATVSPVAQQAPTDPQLPASMVGTYWNNFGVVGNANIPSGTTLSNLVDSTNVATGVNLAMTGASTGGAAKTLNTNGTSLSTIYPISATKNHVLMITGGSAFTLTLSNLDVNAIYDLTMYGSRNDAGGANRDTDYTVAGLGSPTTVTLAVTNNVDGVASVLGVSPTASGTIDITVFKAAGSSTGIISVLDVSSVPEPTSLGLLGIAGLTLLRRRNRA